MEEKITLSQAAAIFKLSISAFYKRARTKRFGYPTLYYKDNKPYFLKKECEMIFEFEKNFENHHVLLNTASSLITGQTYLLNSHYQQGKFNLFSIIPHNHKLYVPRSQFNDFYATVCREHALIPLSRIKQMFIEFNAEKFNFFCELYEFDKLQFWSFDNINKRWYNYYDIKKWLRDHNLNKKI